MNDVWYYGIAGQQHGPVGFEQLKQLGASGQLRAADYVWTEGMPQWKPAGEIAGLFASPPALANTAWHAPPNSPAAQYNGTKIAAGVLGILFGALGVHKFVAGMVGPGVVLLLITVLSCGTLWPITHAIGIIEGVIYLTKSDEDFYQMYIVGKKSWF